MDGRKQYRLRNRKYWFYLARRYRMFAILLYEILRIQPFLAKSQNFEITNTYCILYDQEKISSYGKILSISAYFRLFYETESIYSDCNGWITTFELLYLKLHSDDRFGLYDIHHIIYNKYSLVTKPKFMTVRVHSEIWKIK